MMFREDLHEELTFKLRCKGQEREQPQEGLEGHIPSTLEERRVWCSLECGKEDGGIEEFGTLGMEGFTWGLLSHEKKFKFILSFLVSFLSLGQNT